MPGPTPEPDRVPDGIEPISAFRLWIAEADGRLHSLNDRSAWDPGEWTVAQCPIERHPAPHEGCSCGLYAAKERSYVLHLARRFLPGAAATVVGRVELSGKVIEHDFGYRAERARVAEVFTVEGAADWAEAVAARYRVPVGERIPAAAMAPLSRAFGPIGPGAAWGRAGPGWTPTRQRARAFEWYAFLIVVNLLTHIRWGSTWSLESSGWVFWAIGIGVVASIATALLARGWLGRRFSRQLRRHGTAPEAGS
jgi:hypothetical protein